MPIINFSDDVPMITPAQYNYILGMMIDLEIFEKRVYYLNEYCQVDNVDDLTLAKADKFIKLLKEWKDKKQEDATT